MTIYICISFSVVHYNSLLKICKLLGNRVVFHTAPNRVLCIWEDTQVLFAEWMISRKGKNFLAYRKRNQTKRIPSALLVICFFILTPNASLTCLHSPHTSPISIRSPSPAPTLPTTQKVNPLLSLIFHRTVLNFNCGGGYTTLCLSNPYVI